MSVGSKEDDDVAPWVRIYGTNNDVHKNGNKMALESKPTCGGVSASRPYGSATPYNFFRFLFSNTKCHGYTTLKLYKRAETKKLLKAHETVGLWFMSGVTATNSSFSS
jgi:hypothetical protein